MNDVKVCPNCRKKMNNDDKPQGIYLYEWDYDDTCICDECKSKLNDVPISTEEYMTITEISNTIGFLEAMIKLKQKDIIKFQSRMFQFKTQLAQQENNKAKNDNTPKCPICGSANIKKISDLSKAGSVAMWGIFSRKVHKQWHCDHCDSEF